MNKLIEMAYDWSKIPIDLPRENLVLITAKTTHPTFHYTDPKYKIRKFTPEELKEAARSLAKRPVGKNHLVLIESAFTVDAQWNESTQSVEALLFLPTPYINLIRERESSNPIKFSVEYTWRDEKREGDEVEFIGLVFDRVDLLDGLNAGDQFTSGKLVEGYHRRGLMEAELVPMEKDIKQSMIQDSIDDNSLSFQKELEESYNEWSIHLGEPFASYKDWDDCIAKNKDKTSPEKYCGYIKARTEDRKNKEATEAEKVKGFTPPEAGDLPEHGKSILANAYASCRSNNPEYSKERCSKIAWGAVKNAGYVKKDDKWAKETSELMSKVTSSPIPTTPVEKDAPEGIAASSTTSGISGTGVEGKQIPESPLNVMTTEQPSKLPVALDLPQVHSNVTSVGAVADDKGPIAVEPQKDNPDKNLNQEPAPQSNVVGDSPKTETPVTGSLEVKDKLLPDKSNQSVEGCNIEKKLEESTKEPKKEEVKVEEKKVEVIKETKVEKPIGDVKPVEPAPKEPDKPIELIVDPKDTKIKEMEGVITKLQENAKVSDSEKAKAVKQAKVEMKKELINEIEKKLPNANIVSNFNLGGQIVAQDMRKIVHKLKESIKEEGE